MTIFLWFTTLYFGHSERDGFILDLCASSSNFTCLQTISNNLKDTKRHLFVFLHFLPSTFWQYVTPIFAFQNYSRTRNGTWVGNRIATAMFYVSKQDWKYFQSKSVSWAVLVCHELNWADLNWAVLSWAELNWARLGWNTKLNWA